MKRNDEEFSNDKKVININTKRKSNFMIFDNLEEENEWIERVEKECIQECIKKEEK